MNSWYFTALLAGLAGSLHCVGMCGPLAMALPVGRLPVYQRFPAVLLYHAGRISAYGLLGLLVGLTGQGLLLAGLQRPISIGSGILLLVWTLTNQKHSFLPAYGFLHHLTSPFIQLLRQPSFLRIGMAGLLNGLLPCGFVYVALAGALAQSSAAEGASYMMLFGAGTLPTLLSIRLIPNLFPLKLRQRFSQALPVLTVVLALLLIGRGLISYVPTGSDKAHSVPICHGRTGR